MSKNSSVLLPTRYKKITASKLGKLKYCLRMLLK